MKTDNRLIKTWCTFSFCSQPWKSAMNSQLRKIQIKQSGYVTSCIDAWKKSSLSCSLLPPMFLRNGFNVRLTSAHIIIGTDSVKSSLRRYWSSVSLKPPLLHASSPKTYERERERKKTGHNFIGICETKISKLGSIAFRKGTVVFMQGHC